MSITWNGVSSDTIGVIVERIPNRYIPTRRFSPQQVAGRNGNFLMVDKSFPNVEQEYEVYLSAESSGLPSVARACAEWLMGPTGYCRLTDSYDTTVYREAFLMGGFDLENILNKFGRCTITFSCKPQKYLLTGDTPVELAPSTDTYTGDIVTFNGVDGSTINSLTASLSPIQNLNGYDSPWPAGGGKNKYSGGDIALGGSNQRTKSINIDTIPAGTYYFSATYGGTAASGYGIQFINANNENIGERAVNGTLTLTDDAVKVYAYMSSSAYSDGKTVNFSNIQVELGSTATSYAPYSNLCPITGRTGVSVYDDPKYGGTIVWNQRQQPYNGYDLASGTLGTVSITVEDGYLVVNGTPTENIIIDPKPSWHNLTVGHVSLIVADGTGDIEWARVGGITPMNTNPCKMSKYTGSNWSDHARIRLVSGQTYNNSRIRTNCFDLTQMFGATKADEIYAMEQAEAGSGIAYFKSLFPDGYYAYNTGTATCVSAVGGGTYWKKDIDWTTPAGTVYGCKVDVVTGVLTVTHVSLTPSITSLQSINSYGIANFVFTFPTGYEAKNTQAAKESAISNLLTAQTSSISSTQGQGFMIANSTNGYVRLDSSVASTKEQANTWISNNGLYIVYELATPQTVQLTAQEVTAIVGQNNLWSNAGSVSVTVFTPINGTITNPTPFDSRPLLTVSGEGELVVNGKSIQILEAVSSFKIDCETMEADDNSKIYCMDFPELSGGANSVSGDGTITALSIVPRWWTL